MYFLEVFGKNREQGVLLQQHACSVIRILGCTYMYVYLKSRKRVNVKVLSELVLLCKQPIFIA